MSQEADQQDQSISIVIIDDHQIFRQGIETNLELHDDLTVVGQGGDGKHGLQLVRDLQPDVVILDINLPLMNGIQVTRNITTDRLSVKVIMLTGYDDAQQVQHAMHAGASAYCAKEIEPEELVNVIRLALKGHYVVHNQVFDEEGIQEWMDKGVEALAGPYYADLGDTFSPLSPREMEILHYVTQGMSNKEIAQMLGISHQTVKNHMTSILRKLAVDDRTQAAVYALRRGWVRLRDAVPDQDDDNAD